MVWAGVGVSVHCYGVWVLGNGSVMANGPHTFILNPLSSLLVRVFLPVF
jgi:hypothetical protein